MFSTLIIANHSLTILSAIMNIKGKDIHKVFSCSLKLFLMFFRNGIDFFTIFYRYKYKGHSNH